MCFLPGHILGFWTCHLLLDDVVSATWRTTVCVVMVQGMGPHAEMWGLQSFPGYQIKDYQKHGKNVSVGILSTQPGFWLLLCHVWARDFLYLVDELGVPTNLRLSKLGRSR